MEVKNLLINKNSSIKGAMRVIDQSGWGIGFVVDQSKRLLGVVTDGDIRRAILKGVNIEKSIEEIVHKKPIFIREKAKEEDLLRFKFRKDVEMKMPKEGSLKVPVVDEQGRVKDIMFFYNDEKGLQKIKRKPKPVRESIRKVLVIGGAGYLGSVLCRGLLNKGYRVKVLDNLTYGEEGIKDLYQNKNFEFQKGDIRNISDIIEGIKDVDAVIHLAAIVGDPACNVDPKETLEINYLATKNIIEVCKYFQINRFIFASTCSVYGKNLLVNQELSEDSPLNPVSLYADTKIKCEKAILETLDENFSPTILRMATLYGYSPNMRFDLAINLITARALFDKKITIFGGEQWRPWLHLEDAALAYINCLEKPLEVVGGEIFNTLSENYKIIDVGKIISSICPEAKLEISNEIADKRDYRVCPDKVSKILNYSPRRKIQDGVFEIKRLVDKRLITNYKDFKYRIS